MALELTSRERKDLRALAHRLGVNVQIGKHGLSETLLKECEQALLAHELIKVQFVGHKEEKHSISGELADKLEACLCGLIGNRAILYRPQPNVELRKIKLQ